MNIEYRTRNDEFRNEFQLHHSTFHVRYSLLEMPLDFLLYQR